MHADIELDLDTIYCKWIQEYLVAQFLWNHGYVHTLVHTGTLQ